MSKRPLVLGASPALSEQAGALGIMRPLENVVEEAISRGELHGATVGQQCGVFLREAGVLAVCQKVRLASGRKAWRPLEVKRLDQRRRVA